MDESGAVNSVDATGNGWTAVANGNWNGDPGFAFLGAAGRQGNSGLSSRQTGDISTGIDTRAQTTPWTVRIWVSGNAGSAYANARIIGEGNIASTSWCILLDATDGNKPGFFSADNAGTGTRTEPGVVVSLAQWYHLAAGYDGAGNQWMSVNGVRTTTPILGLGVRRNIDPIVINGLNNAIGFGAQSLKMDEAVYWNVSKSVAEMLDDYNGGAGRNYAYVSTH